MKERKCWGCGCDLTHEHHLRKRCVSCVPKNKRARGRSHYRRHRSRLIAASVANHTRRMATDPKFRAKQNFRTNRRKAVRYKTDAAYREKRRATMRAYMRRRRAEDKAFKESELLRVAARESRKRAEVRDEMLATQGGLCGLCGEPMTDAADSHVDHIHPRSLGGDDSRLNLHLTHAVCNLRKHNRVV